MKKIYLIGGAILIALLLVFSVVFQITKKHYQNEIGKIQKEKANLQVQVKEREGIYSTEVDKWKVTERELKDSIKSRDKELMKLIRKNKEEILYYEGVILGFKPQRDTVLITDTIYGDQSFRLSYPDTGPVFIQYTGIIQDHNILGDWKFGQLSLTATTVEQKDGTWKHYVSGPEWITFSNIEVKAQPRLDPKPTRKFYFPLGVGYEQSAEKGGLMLTGGVQWKRLQVIGHASQYSTGVGFMYLF